jgi:hypothetical protein
MDEAVSVGEIARSNILTVQDDDTSYDNSPGPYPACLPPSGSPACASVYPWV